LTVPVMRPRADEMIRHRARRIGAGPVAPGRL